MEELKEGDIVLFREEYKSDYIDLRRTSGRTTEAMIMNHPFFDGRFVFTIKGVIKTDFGTSCVIELPFEGQQGVVIPHYLPPEYLERLWPSQNRKQTAKKTSKLTWKS